MERWIQLQRYAPLRTSEDTETVDRQPPHSRLVKWLALRRVRSALVAGVVLLVFILSIHFIDLTTLSRAVHEVTNEAPPESKLPPNADDPMNWSDYAYVQYVTNTNYLCNSVMILEALHRSQSKADRIMMYPEGWNINDGIESETDTTSKLLKLARDVYKTKLVPIQVQTFARGDATWQDSFTKLLAFNQTQYKRLISLDSDATVIKHMDELFHTPSSPVAMPRAYWLDQPFLSSQLILLEPSSFEWHRIQTFMERKDSGFDMDILNSIYKDSCVVLPHRRYNLLTGEFRGNDESHKKYLGSEEAWNGTLALEEASFIHFSDWPLPKPWIQSSDAVMASHQPKCKEGGNGEEADCTDRDIWLNLYKDFSERRQRVCGRHYDRRDSKRRNIASARSHSRYEFVVA